ncbi:uncharacterized protein MELLADRAFT_109515 [Melampsora larici-populina 98AG31]|uniref:Uncharacterized protein n=1 Tax=Melampsora larici-populina (strain 98AG31 / pathotype 3-4-7) TaxID=747676 RepID=F4RWQ8_MELLP|nr:uncharacterized protein MELLADRAFT_109515 [Melampsora larici-populina 98AG31]EGG03187.1 hypothetical protein MELLADRAFT_109515 [Melampsora larici-populina 98AG31]
MDSEDFQKLIDEKVRKEGEEQEGEETNGGERISGEEIEGNGGSGEGKGEDVQEEECQLEEGGTSKMDPAQSTSNSQTIPTATRQSKRKVGPPKPYPPAQAAALKAIGPIRIKKARGRPSAARTTETVDPSEPNPNIGKPAQNPPLIGMAALIEMANTSGTTTNQPPAPPLARQQPQPHPPQQAQVEHHIQAPNDNHGARGEDDDERNLGSQWQNQMEVWNDTRLQENPNAVRGVGGIVLGEREEEHPPQKYLEDDTRKDFFRKEMPRKRWK